MSSAAPLLLALLLAHQAKAVKVADTRQQRCTATALYMEANTQSFKGRVAVRDVIRNRAKKLNKNACRVVFQPNQFSWVGNKKPPRVHLEDWADELHAKPVLSSDYLYFFRKDMQRPPWSKGMLCRTIDEHKFCKER